MITVDLYIRVSTDEQAEKGYSQRNQEEILRKFPENKMMLAFYLAAPAREMVADQKLDPEDFRDLKLDCTNKITILESKLSSFQIQNAVLKDY